LLDHYGTNTRRNSGKNLAGSCCFSPDRAKREMVRIGNSQPELLAFVTESAQEMGGEVRELVIYMFREFVIPVGSLTPENLTKW
jgi:hypothetical protein